MTEEQRAWQTVLSRVESDLLDGTLVPGDRLPGERALAAELGVGRSSVREALRVLEVLGLIRTAAGSGPGAGAIIVATPRGGMSALLRLQVAAQGFALRDIVATRLVLETSVAETLAHQHPDLGDAEALLTAMNADGLTPDEFLALDARFHLSLAEASGNAVIAATMAGLRDAIESYVREGSERIEDWPPTAARLRAEHAGLLSAITDRDPDAARTRVHDHITGYYAQITDPSHREESQNGHSPAPEAR
ncbi:FadR/GntR family transcriptional regulator [Paramicrobacterium chengjingii]|uniref:FadR family transcriptional regulator n=1 Tax=Paramicrobacterium chengjingii TaxID=2769067 RepID=A0ABX6YJA3_9MICO|nr:FCD domain-containing protein [Microbacterium chengjingii]QPZ38891.1 FadR family transcriptional regulator [Microbacterium chengjingii]